MEGRWAALHEKFMPSPFVQKDGMNVITQIAVRTASVVVLLYFMHM
jgi:hypothetical protein